MHHMINTSLSLSSLSKVQIIFYIIKKTNVTGKLGLCSSSNGLVIFFTKIKNTQRGKNAIETRGGAGGRGDVFTIERC